MKIRQINDEIFTFLCMLYQPTINEKSNHRLLAQNGICFIYHNLHTPCHKEFFEIPPCGKMVIFVTEFVICSYLCPLFGFHQTKGWPMSLLNNFKHQIYLRFIGTFYCQKFLQIQFTGTFYEQKKTYLIKVRLRFLTVKSKLNLIVKFPRKDGI